MHVHVRARVGNVDPKVDQKIFSYTWYQVSDACSSHFAYQLLFSRAYWNRAAAKSQHGIRTHTEDYLFSKHARSVRFGVDGLGQLAHVATPDLEHAVRAR